MYLEVDTDQRSDANPVTFVNDVAFICKNPAYGTFKLNYVRCFLGLLEYFLIFFQTTEDYKVSMILIIVLI